LQGDPQVRQVLATHGEPDTVEVVTVRGGGKRVRLTYRQHGRTRRFDVTPSQGKRSVRAHGGAARRVQPADHPAPDAEPTLRQRLECPIEPEREDCKAFCARKGTLEWCRPASAASE
jgi:hypothetical protein